jgi:hypothetical protein
MDLQKRIALAWLAGSALAGAPWNSVAAEPVVLRIYKQDPANQKQGANPASKARAPSVLLASYDMAFLKSLPQHSFVSQTPWFKKPVTFTGPLLRDVLSETKVKGSVVYAVAIDEYRAQIPFTDCVQYDMILAHQIDGETLTPKNKGPLFVVYPYDSKPELQSVRFYERSIWQLKSLRVE